MNSKRRFVFLRCVIFLLCAALLFCLISRICERKTYSGPWNYMAKLNEFYSMEEDSLEYLCIGSSHMYCTVNPLEVWKDSGIPGFVLATQQQPLTASYYYIKEALKTQSPKVVFVEAFMINKDIDDSAVFYDAIDPLKFSINKLQLINNLVPQENRPNYYFNILKYHTRWKDIGLGDIKAAFVEPKDFYKGFVALDGTYQGTNYIPDYSSVQAANLTDESLEILAKIKDLIQSSGAKMVLLIAPNNDAFSATAKAATAWAQDNNVDVLDYSLLLDQIGVDPSCDYYDGGHLDISGAQKVSLHFSNYLKGLGITGNPNIDSTKWQQDYERSQLR